MKRAVKVGVAGSGIALLLLGGAGVYEVVSRMTHDFWSGDRFKTARGFDPTAVSSTPPANDKAAEFVRSFLRTWSQDHTEEAAQSTDTPATASVSLRGYADGLHLKKVSFDHVLSAGPSSVTKGATKVTFDVTAQVAGGTWSYPSAVAVQQSTDGVLAVHWNNSVLYPGLGDRQSLTAGELPPGAVPARAVASDGHTDLSTFPSLRDISATSKNAKPNGIRPAREWR
ncbi:NTF2-like N-terminal transpeptidase domain-containing protein [Streptomyces sp. OV198]|jgi:hypothetical protein|uniref:NTF2-like N-terminal transpeptidase domain-containing protein n=1 Tax=Streptomyces sp. OV198 TaxID=1882787 RepID=UPI00211B74BC|nr:NTF2-like N-terminal transpeptidase domain-containing protein [Streptomyces sp. OV198]